MVSKKQDTGARRADGGNTASAPEHIGSVGNASGGSEVGQVRLMTVAEVADAMRVSKMTVYRLVHSGELPAARVGRSFRVPENAVHQFLQNAFYDAG